MLRYSLIYTKPLRGQEKYNSTDSKQYLKVIIYSHDSTFTCIILVTKKL